ncbi:hypothetical protein [Actinoplanes siamensis]|uniref:Uncharacterized protein n=1 Tax=Actinoplanes siamensis TaxID=1223317 RepID=A0A919TL49_9ACTN|nr:hypothetical protein [Actinoplanes siamensis]GIF05800.1 hypothetical protein Asi03nite_33380 [Actinoplanes siamensis]
MATDQTPQAAGFAEVSRTLVAIAAEVLTGVQRAVVGPGNVRTARDNAWSAIEADRARAQARADTSRAVAEIVATGPRRTVAAARHRARAVAATVR